MQLPGYHLNLGYERPTQRLGGRPEVEGGRVVADGELERGIHVGVGPLVGTVAGAVVGAGLDLIIAYLDDEVK